MIEKLTQFMEDKIVPIASKIGAQRHLLCIRDAFLGMLALTMVSSLATLVAVFPIAGYKNWLATSEIGMAVSTIASNISWGAFSFMALFAAIAVGNSLWKSYGKEGIEGALISAASLFILSPRSIPFTPEGSEQLIEVAGLNSAFFGATALFTGIIVAILSVELLRVLSNCKQLQVKMPEMVPPAVSKSFMVMFPAMITLVVAGIVAYLLKTFTSAEYLNTFISQAIQAPLSSLTDTIGAAIIIPLVTCVLWSIGLHGSNLTDAITMPLYTTLASENMELAAKGVTEGFNTITGPFMTSFVWIGGAGCTIGLLLAVYLSGKKVKERFGTITNMSIAPGCFNINEPVIFGFPIVLNPVLMIPFILVPLVLSVFSYIMVSSGIVNPTIVASIPWTTPPILSGFLATGHWTGAALSGFNLILSIVMYLPFVGLAVKVEEKEMLRKASEKEVI